MKIDNKKLRNLIVILLVLLLGTIVLEVMYVYQNRDIQRFKQKMLSVENLSDTIVYNNKSEIERGTYSYLKDDNISFCVYENDRLVYWSDFEMNISYRYSDKLFAKPFVKLNNGYYDVRLYDFGYRKIVGLIRIYEKYSLKNTYLQNRFTDYFSQIHVNSILRNEAKGVPIYTKEGNYLFSLSGGKRLSLDTPILVLIVVLYFIFVTVSFFLWRRKIASVGYKKQLLFICITGVVLFLLRYVMLKYKIPISLRGLTLFSPKLHASSFIYRSLGDFWLNIVVIQIFLHSISLLKVDEIPWFKRKILSVFLIVLSVANLSFITMYSFGKIESLVMNSIFSMQMQSSSMDNTLFSFFAYSGATLCFCLIIISVNIVIQFARKSAIRSIVPILWTVFSIVLLAICLFVNTDHVNKIIYVSALGYYYILKHRKLRRDIHYLIYVVVLIFSSLYLTHVISNHNIQKSKRSCVVQAKNIIYEEDPMRSIMLETISSDIERDERLNRMLMKPMRNEALIREHIMSTYFNYRWSNYMIDIFFCHKNIGGSESERNKKCTEAKTLLHGKKLIVGDSFFYKAQTLTNSEPYIGVIPFNSKIYSDLRLIIMITAKLYDEELGYPELLANSVIYSKNEGYPYAKYFNGELKSSKGNFDYFYELKDFYKGEKDGDFIKLKDHNHYIYTVSGDYKLVVSPMVGSLYFRYNAFPYVILLFFLASIFLSMIENQQIERLPRGFYQRKMKYYLIGMLALLFFLVAGVEHYYAYEVYKSRYEKQHKTKIKKIRQVLFRDLRGNSLNQKEWDNGLFDNGLKNAAKLTGADINIYNIQGRLTATSQPEIFKENIISTRMNREAMEALQKNRLTEITVNESIGKLKYNSVYATVWDKNKNPVAYLNIPFFLNYKEFVQEIQTLMISLLSISLFIIILITIISILLSRKITSSLDYLQKKFLNVHLTKKNTPIKYEKVDEIAPLVNAYNRMLEKIQKQSEELAQNEKESAWREMARQIAHEIKNPLTPMKLNIQFLQRKLQQKDENWEEKFYEVSNVILKEVDELAETAAIFSDFAKIAKAEKMPINILTILEELLTLYSQNDIKLILDKRTEDAMVLGDKMQVRRVLINIIGNAIQSTLKKEERVVRVFVKKRDGWIKIYVKDNGSGIKKEIRDKVFRPNFTTKSSGMGLGLAITKEIIEHTGGDISFRTVEGEGTIFIIKFPHYDKVEEVRLFK